MSGEHDHPEYAFLDEHRALEERVAALEEAQPVEPPIEPPPIDPPDRVPTAPYTRNGDSGFVIERQQITRDTPGVALMLLNCHDFEVRDIATYGGGVLLSNCWNFKLDGNLHEQTLDGNPGWDDNELGVRMVNCRVGQVSGSVMAYFDSLIHVRNCDAITLDGNFTYNPRGPMPRGQHIQAWYLNGRNRGIDIFNHYSLTDFTNPGPWEPFQEDAISIGQTDGGTIRNTLSEMIQLPSGSGSRSGSGLMFEGSNYTSIEGFTSIGQANHGWGVRGGSTVGSMTDTLSVYSSPVGTGHTAGVVGQTSTLHFGAGVRLYGDKPNEGLWGAYWQSNDSTTTGKDSVRFGSYADGAGELAAVERPSIPDVGFVLPGA